MWYNVAMKILIDADGCPVVDLTLQAAAEHGLEAILFCDTSHEFKEKNARVVTVDKGSDSADFRPNPPGEAGRHSGDPGLRTGSHGAGQAGLSHYPKRRRLTDANIDTLLLTRHAAKKARRGGYRLKGPSKRTAEQDKDFQAALRS